MLLTPGRGDGAKVRIAYGRGEEGFGVVPLEPLAPLRAEEWTMSPHPERVHGWAAAVSGGELLLVGSFGSPGDALGDVTEAAYTSLISTAGELGCPALIRVWNYVRDINGESGGENGGLERYKQFSIGRHEGFRTAGYRLADDLPAASAVGSYSGAELTIVALAGASAGRHLENPRQVSAWAYPPRYGPRSPSFSRATIMESGSGRQLWISGTASIVGHETHHAGDVVAQLDETLRNIEALTTAAGFAAPHQSLAMMKIYVRRPADQPLIASAIGRHRLDHLPLLWVHADICRSELLLEIEALAVAPSRTAQG